MEKGRINKINVFKMALLKLSGCTLLFSLVCVNTSFGEPITPLIVENRLLQPRSQEPVSFGLPLSEKLGITGPDQLAITDAGGERIPAQFTPLARWLQNPNKPIKWVFIDFLANVPSSGKTAYYLVKGQKNPQPTPSLSVINQETSVAIDTGAVKVILSKKRFSLFEQVLLDMDQDGKRNDNIVDYNKANGLSYEEDGSKRFGTGLPPEEVTIETSGPIHAVISVRGWFTSSGDQHEYLYYIARYHFYAGSDVVRLVLTVTDRHDQPVKEGWWDSYWDEQRVHDLKLRLSFLPSAMGNPVHLFPLDGDASFSGSKNKVTIHQQSSHSQQVTVDEKTVGGFVDIFGVEGSPTEWTLSKDRDWLGWKGSYFLKHKARGKGDNKIVWNLAIPVTGRHEVFASWAASPFDYQRAKDVTYEVYHQKGKSTVVLDQGPISGDGWHSLGTFTFQRGGEAKVVLKDTGKNTVTADGVRLSYRGEEKIPDLTLYVGTRAPGDIFTGNRFLSDLGFAGRKATAAFSLRQSWQNYPNTMSAVRDGTLEIGLLPGGPHTIMGGMGKTSELFFTFKNGGTRETVDAMRIGLDRMDDPLHPLAPPSYYGETGALSSLHFFPGKHAKASADIQRYEDLVSLTREGIPSNMEQDDSFGWRSFGDYTVSTSYGNGTENWGNNQHFQLFGYLVQYLRTQDKKWWYLGEAATRHMMDIDFVKFHPFREKYNGTIHRKGECGPRRTHVCTEPIMDMSFAPPVALLYYHLTGDPWAKEVAFMGIKAQSNFLSQEALGKLSPSILGSLSEILGVLSGSRLDFISKGGRPTAWVLKGLLAGYQETGDQQYIQLAKIMVSRILERQDPVTGSLLQPPDGNASFSEKAPSIQPVWLGWTIDALIEYYWITKEEQVRDAIVGLARFIRDYTLRFQKYSDGPYLPDKDKDHRYILYVWTYEKNPSVKDGKTNPTVASVSSVKPQELILKKSPGSNLDITDTYKGKKLLLLDGVSAGKAFLISASKKTPLGDMSIESTCVKGDGNQCADPAKGTDFISMNVKQGNRVNIIQKYESHAATIWSTLNGLAFAAEMTKDLSFLRAAIENFRDATQPYDHIENVASTGDYLSFPFYFLNAIGSKEEGHSR